MKLLMGSQKNLIDNYHPANLPANKSIKYFENNQAKSNEKPQPC